MFFLCGAELFFILPVQCTDVTFLAIVNIFVRVADRDKCESEKDKIKMSVLSFLFIIF